MIMQKGAMGINVILGFLIAAFGLALTIIMQDYFSGNLLQLLRAAFIGVSLLGLALSLDEILRGRSKGEEDEEE